MLLNFEQTGANLGLDNLNVAAIITKVHRQDPDRSLHCSFQFQDFRFLCPNDTVFDQQNLVCTNWFEVDCKSSIHFFAQEIGLKEPSKVKNDKDTRSKLFGTGHGGGGNSNSNVASNDNEYEEYEEYDDSFGGQDDDGNRFLVNRPPASTSGSRGVGGGDRGQVRASSILRPIL